MEQEQLEYLKAWDDAIVGTNCFLLTFQDKIDWPITFISEKLERLLTGNSGTPVKNVRLLFGGQACILLETVLNEVRWERSGVASCSIPVRNVEGQMCWFKCVVKRHLHGHNDTFLIFLQNVTAFHRMVAELRLREARNHQAKNIAGLGLWSTEVGSGHFEVCDQTMEIYRLDEDDFPVTNDVYFSGLSEDDKTQVSAAFMETIRTGNPARFEHAFKCRDGTNKFLRQIWDIEERDDQRIKRIIGTVQDITLEKQSEIDLQRKARIIEQQNDRLEHRQAQIQSLLDSSSDPMYFIDTSHKIADANEAFLDVVGMNRADVIGQSCHDIFEDNKASAIRQENEQVMSHQLVVNREEWVNSAKYGGTRLFEIRKNPVRGGDNSILGVFAVFHDVTEKERIQKEILRLNEDLEGRVKERTRAVEKSRQRYMAILNNVPQYLMLLSEEGTVIDANRSALDALGVEIEEVYGKPIWSVGPWASSDLARDKLHDFLLTVKSGKVANMQMPVKRRNRKTYILDVNFEVVLDTDGSIAFITLAAHDITELKTTQKNLTEARNTAEDANRAKSLFLAKMSHEIRTPMNGIIGSVDLLQSAQLSGEEQELLGMIRQSSSGLLQVINDILDFSKSEAGHITLEEIAFCPRQLAEQVEMTLRHGAAAKGVVFKIRLDDALPKAIIGDPVRLRQILLNLTGNAIKFTSPEGRRKAEVTLAIDVLESSDGAVTLKYSVRDTGIGIPESGHENLFSPFSQVDSSITREYGGTGLGLAICKQLSEAMGGHIEFSSVVGEGTVFSVEVAHDTSDETPLRLDAPKGGAMEDAPGVIDSLPECSVLLVEDNEINRTVLYRHLKSMGMEVEVAADGVEALERLGQKAFDILITDWHMPNMDGLTLVGKIRNGETAATGDLSIVVLSADAVAGASDKCLEAGADYYVSKPIGSGALFMLLKKILVEDRPEREDAHAIIDFERLGIFLGNDRKNQIETMQSFVDMAQRSLESIRQLANSSDYENVADLAHSLKSSARMICADALGQASEDLELYCKDGQTQKIDNLIEVVEDLFLEVSEQIETLPESWAQNA